jgi:uncharacterized protein (DUF58 family)
MSWRKFPFSTPIEGPDLLTPRGWWSLLLAIAITVIGLVYVERIPSVVGLLGLSLLAYFFIEFWLFAGRARSAQTFLRIERSLLQSGREVQSAWAGVPCQVRVRVYGGPRRIVLAIATDRLPPGIVADARAAGPLDAETPLTIEYDAEPPGPGALRFEGVEVWLTDFAGLFARRLFVRQRVEYPVLPRVLPGQAGLRAYKRVNALPPPGAHRMKRPGGGTELLDLRDYVPGDPPKMIAWKPSARRDALIVKEYETDVPVRGMIFLDASEAVRIGEPGQTAACRLAGLAAALGQEAIDARDLVGLSVFDEQHATRLAPARSNLHAVKMLTQLAEAAGRPPAPGIWTFSNARRAALPLAHELYPELFEASLNSTPRAMHWKPVLDTRWGWLLLVPIFATPILAVQPFWIDLAASFAKAVRPRGGGTLVELPAFLLAFVAILLLPVILAVVLWLWIGLSGFFDAGTARRRKRLASLFAMLDGDEPAAIERYLKDDGEFTRRAAVFLADHGIRPDGEPPVHRTWAKAHVLADALVRSIAVAKDNESYTILADLVPVADESAVLFAAIRAARGRHHKVFVVVPWPADMPDPNEPVPKVEPRLYPMAREGRVRQYIRRFHDLKLQLAKLGVTVVRFGENDSVPTVLNRLHGRRRAPV